MSPGSDSHKVIGFSHWPRLALRPGLPMLHTWVN